MCFTAGDELLEPVGTLGGVGSVTLGGSCGRRGYLLGVGARHLIYASLHTGDRLARASLNARERLASLFAHRFKAHAHFVAAPGFHL